MRPARRITQKNNSIGGICRRTYCNPKQIGGILIAKLIVAEKPSVAMSYAKVLGATNHQDGYLEGNGYLVSWCVLLSCEADGRSKFSLEFEGGC